jgi:hypothetical protein
MAAAYLLSDGIKVGLVFPGTMFAFGVTGMFVAILTARRWRYARFYSDMGELAFTLRCPPEDAAAFDGFIDAVATHVRSVNPTAQPERVYCCGAKRSQQIHPWLNKPG